MSEFEKWFEKNSFFITHKIESEAVWLAAFYCMLKMQEHYSSYTDFIEGIKQEIKEIEK